MPGSGAAQISKSRDIVVEVANAEVANAEVANAEVTNAENYNAIVDAIAADENSPARATALLLQKNR